jgi:6-phosphogluconolactonase
VVREHALNAVRERGRFTLAVSGGTTPWAMLSALAADETMPWPETDIYQVDERVAPEGDTTRNLTHLLAALPLVAHDRVVAMPVGHDDLEVASDLYAELLPFRLDLVHLGLGTDGHTASLVPGDAVLEVNDRDVATCGPYQGTRRMTLTYPAIERARSVLWLVTGAEKAEMLVRLLARDPLIPAGRVSNADQWVLADAAAAAPTETAE